jgi:hypothetical protein
MQINRRGKFLVNQLKNLTTTRKISCHISSRQTQNRGASLGPRRALSSHKMIMYFWTNLCANTITEFVTLSASRLLHSEWKQWIIRHAPQQQAAPRLRPSDCLAINQIEQQKRICISRLTLNIYLLFRTTPTTWLMWSARARALITHSQCCTTHLTSRSAHERS